jgi:hypothetical protein
VIHEDSSPAAGQLREDLAASQQEVEVTTRPEAPSPLPTRRESRWLAENTVSSSSRQPSNIPAVMPRGRRKWTEEEDDRLIMLVAKHGTQWAVIQRQDQICPASDGGPQLTGRTQVNMKDRARTIKKKLIRYDHLDFTRHLLWGLLTKWTTGAVCRYHSISTASQADQDTCCCLLLISVGSTLSSRRRRDLGA